MDAKTELILCPAYGRKTREKIQEDTQTRNFNWRA